MQVIFRIKSLLKEKIKIIDTKIIINFSNQNVYESKLNMHVKDDFNKPFSNNMIALDVRGKRTEKENQKGNKNENKVEAEACIQTIKYIKEQDKNESSIAIVTPYKEQKHLIESKSFFLIGYYKIF